MLKDKAADLYKNQGYNCSQAVLSVFADRFGIPEDMVKKISAGFGGGFARNGEVCGVISAMTMVIGLSSDDNEIADKNIIYKKINDYIDEFYKKHGTIKCKELIGYDISIPEELQKAREEKVFSRFCSGFVSDGTEILEKLSGGRNDEK